MSVDRAALRRRLVDGWKPGQTVEVEVRTLAALLDELDGADTLRQACEELAAQWERQADKLAYRADPESPDGEHAAHLRQCAAELRMRAKGKS